MSVGGRPAKAMILLAFAAVSAAALVVGLNVARSRTKPARTGTVRLLTVDLPFPKGGRFAADPYAGSRVCSECHPGEAALQSRSGHARTLSPVGRLPLARRLDGTTVRDPLVAEVIWSYRLRDGQLHLERKTPGQVEECILEYAFGSGHHATTFVNVIDPRLPAILEHRLTYYPREDAVGITPGHIASARPPWITAHGSAPPPDLARRCFSCHATQVSAGVDPAIDMTTMIPNVTCERCHGPGRAHVAAARRGAPEAELSLPFGLDRWSAEGVLALCGDCHRHPSFAHPEQIRPDDPRLVRFQPIGIMQSKCYTKSGGGFSCVTCHDPHARTSTDRPAYDAICLSCHSVRVARAPPGGAETLPVQPAHGAGATCPISPEHRCVECHMPRVDGGQFFLVSDHWIRVRRPEELPSSSSAPAARLPHLAPRRL
jgi:Cytochrome c554 and c-prime